MMTERALKLNIDQRDWAYTVDLNWHNSLAHIANGATRAGSKKKTFLPNSSNFHEKKLRWRWCNVKIHCIDGVRVAWNWESEKLSKINEILKFQKKSSTQAAADTNGFEWTDRRQLPAFSAKWEMENDELSLLSSSHSHPGEMKNDWTENSRLFLFVFISPQSFYAEQRILSREKCRGEGSVSRRWGWKVVKEKERRGWVGEKVWNSLKITLSIFDGWSSLSLLNYLPPHANVLCLLRDNFTELLGCFFLGRIRKGDIGSKKKEKKRRTGGT